MKKIKCYGRVKTNKLDSSKNQAVFDSNSNALISLGIDSQEKNKFPESDLSDMQLFASFHQASLNQSSLSCESPKKGRKRRKLNRPAKRVSFYLRRKRGANVSKRSNISLLSNSSTEHSSTKKPVLKKASSNMNTSRNSRFQRKCKKGSGIAKSKNKLGNKNRSKNHSKKLIGQKLPQKRKKKQPLNKACDMSPISNEPYWPSIFEHSLNIENQNEWRFNAFRQNNIKACCVKLSRLPLNLGSGASALVPNNNPLVHEENDRFQLSAAPEIKDCCVRLSRLNLNLESETVALIPADIPCVHEENDGFQLSTTPPKIKDCCVKPSSHPWIDAIFRDISFVHEENSIFQLSTSISDPLSSYKPLPMQRIFNEIRSKTSNVATSTPLRSYKKTNFTLDPQFNLSGIYKSTSSSVRISDVYSGIYKSTPSSVRISDVYSGIYKLDPDEKLIPETFLEAAQNLSNAMNLNPAPSHSAVVSNRSLTHSNILQTSEVSISRNRTCDMHSVRKKVSSKKSFHSSDQVNSFCPDVECNLSKLLEHCEQDAVFEFNDVFDWSVIAVKKIGEGTYGEVFMITKKKSSSVIKVIPFTEINNDPSMQTIETVYSEMKVAHCLSELRTDMNNQTQNFNKLKSAKIVQGMYPNQMLEAWDTFSDAKTTYNCRPDVFEKHQKFAILELEFGGKDMSEFVMRNAAEAECIFKQIAISLAIAEEAYLFEHRDLHLGNILVQRSNSKKLSYILRGKQFSIPNEGLVVTIIDFTLSRVLKSGCVFYNDLANDESLFNQSGDYQFEVYKQTREYLNNEWQKSALYSNVLWLSFFCVKALKYEYSRPKSKKHLEGRKNIQVIRKKLSECNSALDVFRFLHIMEDIPERSHAQSSRLSRTTKFWDRKSLQKSNIGN